MSKFTRSRIKKMKKKCRFRKNKQVKLEISYGLHDNVISIVITGVDIHVPVFGFHSESGGTVAICGFTYATLL